MSLNGRLRAEKESQFHVWLADRWRQGPHQAKEAQACAQGSGSLLLRRGGRGGRLLRRESSIGRIEFVLYRQKSLTTW